MFISFFIVQRELASCCSWYLTAKWCMCKFLYLVEHIYTDTCEKRTGTVILFACWWTLIIIVVFFFSGEQTDTHELGRLLQLILGCAVNCEDKQEYIQIIMSMEESVQHVVMNAIQEVGEAILILAFVVRVTVLQEMRGW